MIIIDYCGCKYSSHQWYIYEFEMSLRLPDLTLIPSYYQNLKYFYQKYE
jgi:hypothetical protein